MVVQLWFCLWKIYQNGTYTFYFYIYDKFLNDDVFDKILQVQTMLAHYLGLLGQILWHYQPIFYNHQY